MLLEMKRIMCCALYNILVRRLTYTNSSSNFSAFAVKKTLRDDVP